MEIAAARQQKRSLATRDAFVGKREFLAACKKSTICPERAQKVLRERFQSELVAVRRLLRKALPPTSPTAPNANVIRQGFLAAAPRPRSEEEPPAEKKRKASPPLPVTQRSDQAPEKMMAGERELDNFLGQRNPRSRERKDSKMADQEEEDVDICGGVSPLAIAPAPLQLAEEEDGYVDICGEASPVVMPKVLGGSGPASSSSSDSGSDSSTSDSDSESGESVSSPAPAERASDDVRKPAAAASALAVPDDPLDDDTFAVDGAWFNDFCGGSMDMSTRAGVDLLEMELDRESSVHLAADVQAGRRPDVTKMNLSPSSSESEDDAADEHWLPSKSSENSGGGTKRRLPQQQSAPSGQRKLKKTESAVVVEGGGSSSNGSGYWCRHCGKGETPQWRAGPEGPNTLCNACGLRYKNTLAMATTTKRLPPAAKPTSGAKRKNGRSVSVMPSAAIKKKR